MILTKCSSVLLKLFPVTRQNEFDKKKMKGKKINKMKKKFQENDDRKVSFILVFGFRTCIVDDVILSKILSLTFISYS